MSQNVKKKYPAPAWTPTIKALLTEAGKSQHCNEKTRQMLREFAQGELSENKIAIIAKCWCEACYKPQKSYTIEGWDEYKRKFGDRPKLAVAPADETQAPPADAPGEVPF